MKRIKVLLFANLVKDKSEKVFEDEQTLLQKP